MSGVTWDQRNPGDWLASNGRWYPESQRPRGWDALALPPAPEHGGAARVHNAVRANTSSPIKPRRTTRPDPWLPWDDSDEWSEEPTSSGSPAPPSPPAQRSSPPPAPTKSSATGRRVAPATASDVRTYKYRLPTGQASPQGLPPASEWRDDQADGDDDAGTLPPAPTDPTNSAPAPPGRLVPGRQGQARTQPQTVAKASASAYAGDLGRVLGKARKKIEDAINEAAEGK